MLWKEVVESPQLKNLPYKIETNEWGQIVMTPARVRHGNYQYKIGNLLGSLHPQAGEIVMECAVRTAKGTKAADVAWFSTARWLIVEDDFETSIAPEICVEVLSPGNTGGEMKSKRKLYFEAGALEVWVCNTEGHMRFYDQSGELEQSQLVPAFPQNIRK